MAAEFGQLLVSSEGQPIRTLTLNMPVLRIGRTPDNGLPLTHQMVSRAHAELRMEAQGVILTDLGSSNGTFIGETRLLPNQPRLLRDGTTFRIGPFLLTYHVARQQEEHTLPAEDETPAREIAAVKQKPEPVPIEAATQAVVPQPRPAKPVRSRTHPPAEPDSAFLRNLPDIYQENDFLRRFLRIFEEVWEPLEQRQDHIETYFDPRTCPASFLPWLAGWLDLPLNPNWPEARQRLLLSQAMELYTWRGTRYGLQRIIEVCTGATPIITEDPSQPFVFRIRVKLPARSDEGIDRNFVEELIQIHKPAHVGYILEATT